MKKISIIIVYNNIELLKKSKGKYIALCEGDDYWVDELKLQKQYDVLENNKNIVLCCNNVQCCESKGTLFDKYYPEKGIFSNGIVEKKCIIK